MALNCVIIDPMEAGLRANCDFSGTGFGTTGVNEFRNISIYKGGVAGGTVGVSGDLWGNQQGAVHLNSNSYYNLTNIKLDSIDLYDSKNNAVFIGSGSGYKIVNLTMNTIQINGTGLYGIYYNGANGNGSYCNISYANIGAGSTSNAKPAAFIFPESCTTEVPEVSADIFHVTSTNDSLTISGFLNSSVSLYNLLGKKYFQTSILSNEAVIPNLRSGIYLVRLDSYNKALKVLIK